MNIRLSAFRDVDVIISGTGVRSTRACIVATTDSTQSCRELWAAEPTTVLHKILPQTEPAVVVRY